MCRVSSLSQFIHYWYDAVDFLVEVGRLASRCKRKVYNFKKADFNQFRDLLAAIPWNCCFGGSVDEDWLKFRDLLLSVADQCILLQKGYPQLPPFGSCLGNLSTADPTHFCDVLVPALVVVVSDLRLARTVCWQLQTKSYWICLPS